jgi:two-component system phosphate regulon sensor histidine kinase PhoR
LPLIQQGETVIRSNIDVRGTPHTVVYHPLFIDGQWSGYYVLAVDEANQQAAESSILVVSSATVLVISVVIGCLIAAALHRFVTRPLHLLSQAARELAAGRLETRVVLQSHDEVGQLGESFNDMAVRIEDRTHELDDLNRTLEARIVARTVQVQQQSAWLEAILCAAREAVLVTDQNRAVRLINAAALDIVGVTEEEALGVPLHELISRAKGRQVEWPEDADNGHQGEIEFRERYYRCSVSPLSAEKQGGYVCVLTDITPLRRLDALKTQVIRVASHDLRTPITSLRLQSQLLKRIADPLTEQQARVLERLDSTVDDLHQMVNDLLDLERIERQASGLRESVSIQSLLESAVAVLASEIENKRHTLEMEIASDLPPVCGDPVLLLEVIRNLLTNAIKYTPPGGKIQVCTFIERERVCVYVKDNGIGIDVEDLPFLFTPHFRAQTALD